METQLSLDDQPTRHTLAPDDYARLLRDLLTHGRLWGKTAPVYVCPLEPKLVIVTTRPDGGDETRADILTSGLNLVFDAARWPNGEARRAAVREVFISAAAKLADGKDGNAVDWRGPDAWTQRTVTLESDYAPDPETPGLWRPRPDAARLVLPVGHDIRMPVPWGHFDVDRGGAIAIRDSQTLSLRAALENVAAGRQTSVEAFYTTSPRTGQLTPVSAFDVYGMYPGFLEQNYVRL